MTDRELDARTVVLYLEEDGEYVSAYASRTIAVINEKGGLEIIHQFFSPESKEYQSWHDAGAYVAPEGVAILKEFLNEQEEQK